MSYIIEFCENWRPQKPDLSCLVQSFLSCVSFSCLLNHPVPWPQSCDSEDKSQGAPGGLRRRARVAVSVPVLIPGTPVTCTPTRAQTVSASDFMTRGSAQLCRRIKSHRSFVPLNIITVHTGQLAFFSFFLFAN